MAQFRAVSGADYLQGCAFQLNGLVTLVDTDRDLVVLQDTTGAVALHVHRSDSRLQAGQAVSLSAPDCCPYCVSFPDFPHFPSGREIRSSFEGPTNWGTFYLSRMRGYLHPPVTGYYSFWIASDNSSELWLSSDADPSKATRIAYMPRFGWVGVHEWSRNPSQASVPVLLNAGESYYVEALHEQTLGDDNLAVAWQGPGIGQSVIGGRYLTSYAQANAPNAATNGVLREYWTNFTLGDLAGLGGARPFESALSAVRLQITIHGPGQWPKPVRISLNQPWRPDDNYRWVQVEGTVSFIGRAGAGAVLDLSDGTARAQVSALHWRPELAERISKCPVRVEGVCEALADPQGAGAPSLIWASAENSIALLEIEKTNRNVAAAEQTTMGSSSKPAPDPPGFYITRGVVTFNDRVFGHEFLFIQEDTAAVRVSSENLPFKDLLKVGQLVEVGGGLRPGGSVRLIRPLVATDLGRHALPNPVAHPLSFPGLANREGRWSEVEGVVHLANSNSTMSVVGKDGRLDVWIGQTPSYSLSGYVDAKLRARGVLLLNTLGAPLLLVPSPAFVDVDEPAPADPFGAPRRPIASLFPEVTELWWPHRARVVGEVTLYDSESFFLQDASGGVHVRASGPPAVAVGQTVEVLAFPEQNGSVRTLTEALVHPIQAAEHARSQPLDLSEVLSSRQDGSLVHVKATLLARRTNDLGQVLELQEQQRVFAATLAASQGSLPDLTPGSRLRVVGVCNNEPTDLPLNGKKSAKGPLLASLNLLMRSPMDVTVLSGPPWWTWRRTATLVCALIGVLAVALLWVHLLRRRLERQQAARLAFSRQVLERLEDERHRIAVNLHDSLGQILLVIKNQALLATQRPQADPGWQRRLDEISGASSQAIEEVRQITLDLRPYQLDRLGLTQAIRASITRASANTTILFACHVDDIDAIFDKQAEIHIYRVIQEAVNNILKHSGATEAAVVVKNQASSVSLSVRDNGRGFDTRALDFSHSHELGYGLGGMTERVRILAGSLAINSRPSQGTSVTIEIPKKSPSPA